MGDTLREKIITSAAAERMLNRVTPIYDNSVVALYMFEAMGREYDTLQQIVDELPAQTNPETATWLLSLWERRYGLTTDETLTLEERRRRIRLRKKHSGAINPYKIKELAANLTGLTAQVNEFVDSYTFEVVLPYISDGDAAFRRTIRKVKPSHLTCRIDYRLGANFDLCTGCSSFSSAQIGVMLPNGDSQAEDDIGQAAIMPAHNLEITLGMDYQDPQDQVDIAPAAVHSSNNLTVAFTVQ